MAIEIKNVDAGKLSEFSMKALGKRYSSSGFLLCAAY
jgi:hypothetical protein